MRGASPAVVTQVVAMIITVMSLAVSVTVSRVLLVELVTGLNPDTLYLI